MPIGQKDRTLSQSERQQIAGQVIHDPLLHGSEALCQLLRYLVERSGAEAAAPLKEHQIATEVFGRPQSFDPRVDSTVRVQTSRLRSKLAEYYATRGTQDPWQIVLPKGSYSVHFQRHEIASEGVEQALPLEEAARRVIGENHRPAPWWKGGIVILVLLAVLAGGLLYFAQRGVTTPERQQKASVAFWNAALPEAANPLVVFSNAQFVGRPETGLRYLQPGKDRDSEVFDQYTGVGEVIAVHELDELFRRIGRYFVLKRGQLLNWDDTKNRDLIFVGSPSENIPLRDLPLNRDFVFQRSEGPGRRGDLGIANLHPQPGEQKIYFGSKNLPITEDYALVELSGQADSSQRVLFLAGTTTFGTQAAVEFVCRADKLASLLTRLNRNRQVNTFSALLRVRVDRGVPLQSEIVAFRQR